MLNIFYLLLMQLFLTSCAQTNQDAEAFNLGWLRSCIYNDGYNAIITLRKNPFTSQRIATDLLLYKAAQVTVEQSNDYFEIISAGPIDLGYRLINNYRIYMLGKEKFYPFKKGPASIRLPISCYPCRITTDEYFIAIKTYNEAPLA